MEYFKGIPGNQPSRIPSRPAMSAPIVQSIPNIQKAVSVPGVDYETKGFGNKEDVTRRMAERIQKMHPEYSPEKIHSEAVNSIDMYFEEIGEERKDVKSFAFIDCPLPDDTQWSDIKVVIQKFNEQFPEQTKVHIFIKNKIKKRTTLHELGLEDTVRERISISGKILLFMSLGSRFCGPSDGRIPGKYVQEKRRLVEDLQSIFGLSTDPFKEEKSEYKLQIELSIRQKDILQKKYPKFLEKTVLELLQNCRQDNQIFS